ncbi:hypothetical protein PZ938_04520 [Luteipulveratus sp. YIM 133132]|uniref:hypothetical protein n=1 Tax=Luteipulveratus flavus TaxID=3031728 RepID=UPI0023AE7AF7|nr:hypothetical protein [Luteipulveratus sp. YIM 133132]MDE9364860.1 hypothetical protein [Luteipulveratus sp. YIM 133132]
MSSGRGTATTTRRTALLGAAGLIGLTACQRSEPSSSPTSVAPAGGGAGPAGTTPPPSTTSTPPPLPQLPRGGRTILPAHRLFGYCGSPASPALGRLGIGDLDERVEEMLTRSTPYAYGRPVLPVLELIATLVHPVPGADGKFRSWVADSVVDTYLAAARRHRALLVLNIQPGRARFIDELRHWERYLVQPDVGVALDPEWAVQPGQVPGRVFGSTTGQALDVCAAYLSGLVAEHRLPEKLMIYHQLHLSIVRNEAALKQHPGVALVKSIDGIGRRDWKIKAYDNIRAQTPASVHSGFKLFYEEDERYGPLMTPAEVMALSPQPEYVLFE